MGPDCWSSRASLASAWITSDNPTSSSAVSRLVHTEPAPRDWSNHSGSLASTNDRPMQHATTSVARDIAIANNTTKRANQSVGKESRSSIDTSSSTYLIYPSKKKKEMSNESTNAKKYKNKQQTPLCLVDQVLRNVFPVEWGIFAFFIHHHR